LTLLLLWIALMISLPRDMDCRDLVRLHLPPIHPHFDVSPTGSFFICQQRGYPPSPTNYSSLYFELCHGPTRYPGWYRFS
jgi:hypothetical protein